jgi:hypothetical protein
VRGEGRHPFLPTTPFPPVIKAFGEILDFVNFSLFDIVGGGRRRLVIMKYTRREYNNTGQTI